MQTVKSYPTFCFSSSSFPCHCFFWTDWQKIGSPSLDIPAYCCVYVLKFLVCEHDMACTLKISKNGCLKQGHMKF